MVELFARSHTVFRRDENVRYNSWWVTWIGWARWWYTEISSFCLTNYLPNNYSQWSMLIFSTVFCTNVCWNSFLKRMTRHHITQTHCPMRSSNCRTTACVDSSKVEGGKEKEKEYKLLLCLDVILTVIKEPCRDWWVWKCLIVSHVVIQNQI